MVNWFGRRRRRVAVPRLKSRGEKPTNINRVDLAELTPDVLRFLGQAAYVQLSIFETLTGALALAPSASAKESIAAVADLSLNKQRGIVAELTRLKKDAGQEMEQYAGRIDYFRTATTGADWSEKLISAYVTAGILDDFYRRLATGLPADAAERVEAVYSAPSGAELLQAQILAAIDADDHLSSRLAMWGRRLVGDTLLIARSALALPQTTASDEARLEPVFTELIAAHTRRMDALGLTA